jgi:hypothetical protein
MHQPPLGCESSRKARSCTAQSSDVSCIQIFDEYWFETYWELPLKRDVNGYIGSATSMRDAEEFWFYDPAKMDKNDTISFPRLRVPRGYSNFWWFGKLANGSMIAPGNYT